MRPDNHLLLPSVFPIIRVFSSESVLRIRWPKYWSFSISPSNEYSGLISFRIGFCLIFLQSKVLSRVFSNTTVQKHQFFIATFYGANVNPYMTIGKIIALIILNFFSKVMSLLLKMLSRFVISFLQTSQHLLIS